MPGLPVSELQPGSADCARGVPLSMSRIGSEYPDADFPDRVRLREETDEEEDEEEDEGGGRDEDEDDDDDNNEGYSE